ncbi:PucR family transcriptional regulator [Kibdelosporangium aridum]|uniref:PucR C-terminal helix-turn-helix domain-containing protein n=1 Tax=Kibdelosporangium aridum TaxID=2030 RepID=A0A1W1ZIC0_KIBAR|nr:PucR family transcriptional regulator [Kibdelosporangium aridum]SMC47932.1 PucR C-terminal helix-turn-helix domain-containing protein [Kibdelosporangium aridum]
MAVLLPLLAQHHVPQGDRLVEGVGMGDLFALWRGRVDANSRRAVDVYTQELPDFRKIASSTRARAAILDFAVFLRKRTVSLVTENKPFTAEDLAFIEVVGRERARRGLSLASQRHVLQLHTSLTLKEVHEAANPRDLEDVMHTLAWLPPLGLAAQTAYTSGFLSGQEAVLPVVERVQQLADMLLADDPIAADMAASLAMEMPESWVVTVARIPAEHPERSEVLQDLLRRQWIPVRWTEPGEFVALTPGNSQDIIQDFWDFTELPCAVGAAQGRTGELAEALTAARQVSQAAPIRSAPSGVYYLTDLFAEVGAARVPPVDRWLGELASRLAAGPDLVATLDAFYRNNMARTQTAAVLNIHPRTLEYRLRRVHDLTGLDPVSVRGVRILSTTVHRVLAAREETA